MGNEEDRLGLSVDDLPSGIIVQDSRNQGGMNPVSATLGLDPGKQWQAEQGEVANYVDDLVPHEFVSEPQAILVHQSALGGQHDRIVEPAAPYQPQVSERLDLGFRYEGSSGGDLAGELSIGYFD